MEPGLLTRAVQGGASVIDVRPLDDFARQHLTGAIYVALHRRTFPSVLRACADPGDLVLVAPSDAMAEAARRLLPTEEGYRIIEFVTVAKDSLRAFDCPTELLGLTTIEELAIRLEDGSRGFRLLDVREPFEWKLGFIAGSTLLSLRDLRAAARGWDPSEEVVCVCEEGFRSASAASVLKKQGIRCVTSLTGGIALWHGTGRPLRE